jgi:hypothetical protein
MGSVPTEWYEDMRANWLREKLRADHFENALRAIANCHECSGSQARREAEESLLPAANDIQGRKDGSA